MLRIKHLRLLRELSQREVANLSDIPHPFICYIERGRMIPTPEQLKRLAKAFKCPKIGRASCRERVYVLV